MNKDNKDINLNIRVNEAMKNQLQKLADNDRRTLSDYIRLQLESIVNNKKK